jgi:hypothetical protein
MEVKSSRRNIIIAPQIYVSLEPQTAEDSQDLKPKRTEIPMIWIQDGNSFRLDIDLPDSSTLDVTFCSPMTSLHVNGETIWENNLIHAVTMAGTHAEMTPAGLRITCTSGGSIHLFALGVMENVLND